MKLSLLKLDKVKKTFKVMVDDVEEEIIIYNLLDEDRTEALNLLMGVTDGKEEETGKKIYELLFDKCTNLEIDCDIAEILDNPSTVSSLVASEIHEILHELQTEAMSLKLLELNDMDNKLRMVLIEEKQEVLESLIEDIKKISDNKPKEEKEVNEGDEKQEE